MSILPTVAMSTLLMASLSWAQWVLPPETPLEVRRETRRLSRAVGLNYGLGRIAQPYSLATRNELYRGLDSKYLTVKAHSLTLTLNLIKNVSISTQSLAGDIRTLGETYAGRPPERGDGIIESSAIDLPQLVSSLSKRILWEVDVLTTEDIEAKSSLLTQTLEALNDYDRQEQEYYALETVNYLAEIRTERARQVVSAHTDKYGSRVRAILQLGLTKVDLVLKELDLDQEARVALLSTAALDSPQAYERTKRFDKYEQEFVLWTLDQIAEIDVKEATMFLQTVLFDAQYRGRIRYKAQELLVERGELERHFQVLPPIPA